MMRIRPIRSNEMEGLLALATEAGVGLTTLPPDRRVLQEKIDKSVSSFTKTVNEPDDETYVFVLEDMDTGQIAGVCAIYALVSQPFYSYKLSTLVQTSEKLNITKEIQVLYLVNDYTYVSEIGTLFLTPGCRQGGNGKLLSLCRFLFMAEFPNRFAQVVIADMRGCLDENGFPPFWKNLGACFFEMDFSEADYLTEAAGKQFIADLMPKYPIYVPLLPKPAQEVIGQVQEATRPAMKMLKQQGFSWKGYVDIFDAGPTLEVLLTNVATVRLSRRATVGQIVESVESETHLICNTRLDFRLCSGSVVLHEDDTVSLPQEIAHALEVQPGDTIRFSPFPKKQAT